MANVVNLRKVHDYRKIPGTLQVRLVGEDHYVRFNVRGEPPLFVQRGTVYADEGGGVIPFDDVPDWLWEQAQRITPEVARATGLDKLLAQRANPTPKPVPEATVAGVDMGEGVPLAPERVAAADTWTCDECGEEIPLKTKGVHIANHNRAKKLL